MARVVHLAAVAEPRAGLSAIAIAAGGSHTCVIASGGGVKCWGNNYNGQLGIGSTINQYSPADVAGTSRGGSESGQDDRVK